MNTESNLLSGDLTLEEKQRLLAEFDFSRFNGVSREVEFNGKEVRVEHGFPFVPELDQLDIIPAWKKGEVGTVYLSDTPPDSQYIYLKAAGTGSARLRLLHARKAGS